MSEKMDNVTSTDETHSAAGTGIQSAESDRQTEAIPTRSPTADTGESVLAGPVRNDLRTMACGFAMGAADIVPGVSGGTVALILGVYERLVSAISSCNGVFVRHLTSGS
ncbi:MAG: DUF368 domain-containing protein, partial [Planctomycetaceae bacterium]|nr:DUF368 domain-containing protein [Planctomycetaceae bacterium]